MNIVCCFCRKILSQLNCKISLGILFLYMNTELFLYAKSTPHLPQCLFLTKRPWRSWKLFIHEKLRDIQVARITKAALVTGWQRTDGATPETCLLRSEAAHAHGCEIMYLWAEIFMKGTSFCWNYIVGTKQHFCGGSITAFQILSVSKQCHWIAIVTNVQTVSSLILFCICSCPHTEYERDILCHLD